MKIIAKSKSVRISPRKLRLIADSIRNMPAKKALDSLMLQNKRAAIPLWKTLKSAVANAVANAKLKEDGLFIKTIEIDGGPALKRFHPSTRGRIHPYKKRGSHIQITLEERSNHGTKN